MRYSLFYLTQNILYKDSFWGTWKYKAGGGCEVQESNQKYHLKALVPLLKSGFIVTFVRSIIEPAKLRVSSPTPVLYVILAPFAIKIAMLSLVAVRSYYTVNIAAFKIFCKKGKVQIMVNIVAAVPVYYSCRKSRLNNHSNT